MMTGGDPQEPNDHDEPDLVNNLMTALASRTGDVGITSITITKELGGRRGLSPGHHELLTSVGIVDVFVAGETERNAGGAFFVDKFEDRWAVFVCQDASTLTRGVNPGSVVFLKTGDEARAREVCEALNACWNGMRR